MAEVRSTIREIRRRTASFVVEFGQKRRIVGKVNAKTVTLQVDGRYGNELPKTLEAVDAMLDLLVAVRAELVEQGVGE